MWRVAALLACLVAPAVAAESCRQALAIGLDVSGSVDERDYALQMGGLATALGRDDVRAALLAMPDVPIWLAVYDWNGPEGQRLIVGWRPMRDEVDLAEVIAVLRATPRHPGAPNTAVGSAILFGAALLAAKGECWQHTLDLTGDGLSNAGPRPRNVAIAPEITVNALVIGADPDPGWDGGEPDVAGLLAWFKAEVIRGPNAFVEPAYGFEDFAEAMARKLLREVSGMRIGALR